MLLENSDCKLFILVYKLTLIKIYAFYGNFQYYFYNYTNIFYFQTNVCVNKSDNLCFASIILVIRPNVQLYVLFINLSV